MSLSPLIITPGQPGPMLPGEFASGSIPNVVTFRVKDLGPPSILYVQRDDQLVLWAVSSSANELVTVTARLLLALPPVTGQPGVDPAALKALLAGPGILPIVTIKQQLQLGAAFTQGFVTVPLAEGYLLSVTVIANLANQRGITFARVRIDRTTPVIAATNAALILLADYVTAGMAPTWPGGRVTQPTESTGALLTVSPANPGLGADISFTIGGQDRNRLSSLATTFVTSATVATRISRLRITDAAGNLVWQSPPSQTQLAGVTAIYSASQGQVTSAVDTTTINWSLPGLQFVGGGWTISTNTLAIQAGDQWSLTRLSIEQWIDQF